MTTQRKSDSARANGARSRGPITPEGKARASQNSYRHGLCAKDILVQVESLEEFEDFRRATLDEFQPRTPTEFGLVDDIVAARWRLRRVLSMQAALLDAALSDQAAELAASVREIDSSTRLAFAFKKTIEESRALELLHRYEVRHERTIRRTLQLLLDLQKQRSAERTQPPPTPLDTETCLDLRGFNRRPADAPLPGRGAFSPSPPRTGSPANPQNISVLSPSLAESEVP